MQDRIGTLLTLVPLFPLIAAVLVAVLGPRLLRTKSHWITIACLAASALCSWMLLGELNRAQEEQRHLQGNQPVTFERVVTLWTWADVPAAIPATTGAVGNGSAIRANMPAKPFRIDIALRADALTVMMLTMVTFISTLVTVFAGGYMHGDRGYWRFFSYIGLFVFSMTMLVSVSNFVLLFVFWEAVGVCSYLLIGFWYEKPEAAAAGKKAFLVNRIGDFGFALAIFLIWATYGTLNYHDSLPDGPVTSDTAASAVSLEEAALRPEFISGVLGPSRIRANDYQGGVVGLAICLLLMLGACGKSAQFPLHVWLPDAMEGPTPVSALIHAATMVTAGVYMVTRCTPLFMVSPDAQLVVAGIGGLTALLAGLIALTQFDLKRVLAYSTVSQLGFMFLGLGTGTFAGITSGMFHLFTHAFFKALLFLGAGSVMHAMGNIIDMRRFSGLRRLMPVTHATFLVGCLALAGVPILAGFWSKDGIVAAVEEKAHQLQHQLEKREEQPVGGHAISPGEPGQRSGLALTKVAYRFGGEVQSDAESVRYEQYTNSKLRSHARAYTILFYGALLTAFLTAFYTFRAFFMTFYGAERVPHEAAGHAHESPAAMYWPLIILAVCSVFVGIYFDRTYLVRPTHLFAEFLRHTPSLGNGLVAATFEAYQFHKFVAGLSIVAALLGIGLALYLYLGDNSEVRWLKSLMNFEFFGQLTDVESASRLRHVPAIQSLMKTADAIHLGWLLRAFGYLCLAVVLMLAAPLTLGNYLAPYKLSRNRFYFDEIYQLVIIVPLRLIADAAYAIDRFVIDGSVNLVGRVPKMLGSLMRSLQMGLVHFYALAMVLGVLVLVAVRMIWANG